MLTIDARRSSLPRAAEHVQALDAQRQGIIQSIAQAEEALRRVSTGSRPFAARVVLMHKQADIPSRGSQPVSRVPPATKLNGEAARLAELEELIRNEQMDIMGVQHLLQEKKAQASSLADS